MVDEVRELHKQYADTYVGYRHNDVLLPFHVHEVGRGAEEPVFYGAVAGKDRWRDSPPIPMSRLCLDFPELGCINYKHTVYYCFRLSDRQWKLGFRLNVVRVEILGNDWMRNLGVFSPRISSIDGFKAIFNPEYFTLQEAERQLLNGTAAIRAIDNKFWLGLAPHHDGIVFGYKRWVVGTYNNGMVHLPPASHHLFEEVSNLLPAQREAA